MREYIQEWSAVELESRDCGVGLQGEVDREGWYVVVRWWLVESVYRGEYTSA
jgi:hypothetical protein